LEPNRALVDANCDTLMALAQRTAENRAAGQNDLFAGGGGAQKAAPLQLKPAKAWPSMETLANEQSAIGFYLTGHPLDEYRTVLDELQAERWSTFSADLSEGMTTAVLAGVVVSKRELTNKKGNRFAFAAFSDQTGQFESVIFSDVLADAGAALEPGKAVLVHVEAMRTGEEIKLKALMIQSLDKAAGASQKGLDVELDPNEYQRNAGALAELKALLEPGGRGEVRLILPLKAQGRVVVIKLPGRYHLSPARTSKIEGLRIVHATRNRWDGEKQIAA
jgi:DNA polymerase III subunit alpha